MTGQGVRKYLRNNKDYTYRFVKDFIGCVSNDCIVYFF
jgi:hypothetical protein